MIRPVAADGRIETGGAFTPIQRPRVLERISNAAQQRLVLLIAPAGYGKSVALTQFLAAIDEPHVRYDVRSDNGTLLGFARGFADALLDVVPDLRKSVSRAFEKTHGSQTPGADLAIWMHAHIKSYSGIVAIDDLHLTEGDPEICKFLVALIERTKGRTRWIIASRSPLDLPIASWLAYGEMNLSIDEMDLRFNVEEARETAKASRVAVRDEELREILAMTGGWPTALSFALRSSVRSVDLRNIEASTREMIYRYLAEQVFRSLTEEERQLLLFTAFLPKIDVEVLKAAGYDRAKLIIEELRNKVAFIYADSPGIYRAHDLFRDFLHHQLELAGDDAVREVRLQAAQAFELAGDSAQALTLFAEGRASQDIVRLIELHGFSLIESGHADIVQRATTALPKAMRGSHPTVLALRGSSEMAAGRFDRAETFYKRAIDLSDNEVFRVATGIRLTLVLLNQGKDAISILGPVLNGAKLPQELQAEATAALASTHALAGRKEEAHQAISEALDLCDLVESDDIRTNVMQRVGFASFYVGDYETARKSSSECVRIATNSGNFFMAARAYSVLTATAVFCDEDTAKTLWYAQQNAACSAKAGDRLGRQTALFQMYEIEVRRGNVERIVAIEDELTSTQTSDAWRASLVLPLRAMRAAWDGRFGDAHRLASGACEKQPFSSARALRRAECALYFIADQRREEGLRFADEAINETQTMEATARDEVQQNEITRLLCALANALAGRATVAARIVRGAESRIQRPVIVALSKVVKAMSKKESPIPADTAEGFEELRTLGYGGYARLLESIEGTLQRNPPRRSVLTPSEVDILQALAQGRSTKDIALESGRSIHTIHAHIRTAIEKLGCSGRNEAIVIARRQGIVS